MFYMVSAPDICGCCICLFLLWHVAVIVLFYGKLWSMTVILTYFHFTISSGIWASRRIC